MNTARKQYGKVEVSDDDFSPSAVRRRISIMVQEDVLAKLKEMAAAEGMPYQTLMNKILRDAVIGSNSISAKLERIANAIGKR